MPDELMLHIGMRYGITIDKLKIDGVPISGISVHSNRTNSQTPKQKHWITCKDQVGSKAAY